MWRRGGNTGGGGGSGRGGGGGGSGRGGGGGGSGRGSSARGLGRRNWGDQHSNKTTDFIYNHRKRAKLNPNTLFITDSTCRDVRLGNTVEKLVIPGAGWYDVATEADERLKGRCEVRDREKPKYVVIFVGVNDVCARAGGAKIGDRTLVTNTGELAAKNLGAAVKLLQKRNIQSKFAIYAVPGPFGFKMEPFNDELGKMLADSSVKYLDWDVKSFNADASHYKADHLHPSELGVHRLSYELSRLLIKWTDEEERTPNATDQSKDETGDKSSDESETVPP